MQIDSDIYNITKYILFQINAKLSIYQFPQKY